MTQGLEESLTWQGRPILGAKEAAKKPKKMTTSPLLNPPSHRPFKAKIVGSRANLEGV